MKKNIHCQFLVCGFVQLIAQGGYIEAEVGEPEELVVESEVEPAAADESLGVGH